MALLICRAKALMEADGDFEDICAQLRLYQAALRTCFTLENFGNLIKNGRMRPLVGTLLHSLGIHVIADATPQGTIHVADKARGEAKTYKAIAALMRSSKDCTGAEVVIPGLLDFCLYCVYNNILDHKLYGMQKSAQLAYRIACRFLLNKERDLIAAMEAHGRFTPPTLFTRTMELVQGTISMGVKMGEGWLLTAEMLELADKGVSNIVCTQPFGCLPNHICGKGMMKPIKAKNPDINIVAIDYDAGATRVNQENRLKLMLANAKQKQQSAQRAAARPAVKEPEVRETEVRQKAIPRAV